MSKAIRKKTLTAAGLMDVLRDPIGSIKEAFSGVPTKLNNLSTNVLEKQGQSIIHGIHIIRTPLKNIWTSTLNRLSFGKFDELKKKYGYDKLFHLSLVVTTKEQMNNRIIIEKNEVVNIAPFKSTDIDKTTEIMRVP